MIGQLRGKLIEKQPPVLMLDVNGVGYLVQAPLSTFFSLPELGQEVILRTHFIVREDAHLLYGFTTKEECGLFQEILKVNGVGPKVALAILSGLTPQEFMDLILGEDIARLKAVPGIGSKTAQRIIVELKDRLPKWGIDFKVKMRLPEELDRLEGGPLQEAIAALVSLGYKPLEATKAVKKVKDPTQNCEHIIKEALQGLAKV
jgi:holliday junction DNA helicase RuvA